MCARVERRGSGEGGEREKGRGVWFKDLAHVSIKTGKSEVCRAGHRLEASGRAGGQNPFKGDLSLFLLKSSTD